MTSSASKLDTDEKKIYQGFQIMEFSKENGKIIIGILCSLLYTLLVQIGDMLHKYTFNHSKVDVFEGLLFRYVINFVIISSNMLAARITLFDSAENVRNLLLAALLRLSGIITLALAIKNTNLGTVSVVESALPALCIIFAWLMLKEKTQKSDLIFGFISYIGVTMVIWDRIDAPKKNQCNFVLGVVYGFVSDLVNCFYYVLTRKVAISTNLQRSIFYSNLVGVIILPFSPWVFGTSFVLTQVPIKFCYFLLASGIAYSLAFLCEIVSLKYLNVGLIMLLRNAEFIWAYAYDMLFDHIFPTPIVGTGLGIIIIATTLIALNTVPGDHYLNNFLKFSCFKGISCMQPEQRYKEIKKEKR